MVIQFPIEGYEFTDEVIYEFGFAGNTFWDDILALVLLTVVYRILVIVSLQC